MLANSSGVCGAFFRADIPVITQHLTPGKAPHYSIKMFSRDWSVLCKKYANEVDYVDMIDAGANGWGQCQEEYSKYVSYLDKLPLVADFVYGDDTDGHLDILPPHEKKGSRYTNEQREGSDRRILETWTPEQMARKGKRLSFLPRRINDRFLKAKQATPTVEVAALEDSVPVPGPEGAGHPESFEEWPWTGFTCRNGGCVSFKDGVRYNCIDYSDPGSSDCVMFMPEQRHEQRRITSGSLRRPAHMFRRSGDAGRKGVSRRRVE